MGYRSKSMREALFEYFWNPANMCFKLPIHNLYKSVSKYLDSFGFIENEAIFKTLKDGYEQDMLNIGILQTRN